MHGAVAIDLGATSGRFAAGWIEDGRIRYEVIEQTPHAAVERDGVIYWNVEALYGLCKRGWDYAAAHFDNPTVGIDSWGVDHGFVSPEGGLVQPPVAYRDLSHNTEFERFKMHRDQLYAATGIQHQPFNTIYQLAARARQNSELAQCQWLLTPDLLGYLLTGVRHCELTMASTTQLMGLDNQWASEAFKLIGWPIPTLNPTLPGQILAERNGVRLASVGSHDTASAVFGLGPLADDQAFLNVGTWSLLGTLIDTPLVSDPRFTNERAVDGRVRYLANIPGFYVINRVHEELEEDLTVPQWLQTAVPSQQGADLMRPEFFNPTSMREALAVGLDRAPTTSAEWAGLAMSSLVRTTAEQLLELERSAHRSFREIRVSGGGSASDSFCQGLANACGRSVVAGPIEATLLGNLGVQFWASGAVANLSEAHQLIANSIETHEYQA